MAKSRDIYGPVKSESDLHRVFLEIRHDVAEASSRPALTELHRRAGYLITLTYSPSWNEKFGGEVGRLRRVAQGEFQKTAHRINRRAGQIGTDANYHESWGHR
jgi:hypothetical protein